MNTLTLETRSLMASNRRWKELSHELKRMISIRTLFAHRTAPLISGLDFDYWTLADNEPRGLDVASIPPALFLSRMTGPLLPLSPGGGQVAAETEDRIVLAHYCTYYLPDFGDAEYDRYQIDSDRTSGISLGRVAGTERWGHEA